MTLQVVGSVSDDQPVLPTYIAQESALLARASHLSDSRQTASQAFAPPSKNLHALVKRPCLPDCAWQQMLYGACISSVQAATQTERTPLTWSVAMAVNCTCGTDVRLTVSEGSTP